ncbi:hypothetical protein LSCM1_01459 [Leishmania martiniquensis]|uniref:non-specific serine/threonine protein kinase n=1 Tax=Leishmania martiniquensis TaxID=1580590 RepID=A0A836GT47_9TRYP|nr:hypothetical protein LSCM1_01459 [Leishmania martiniquensis]
MLPGCAGQATPSSPVSRPEAYATVFSCGSDAGYAEPVSAHASIAASANLTPKPSPHRVARSSGHSGSLKLGHGGPYADGAHLCEEALSTTPVQGAVIIEKDELSLVYARRVCRSDAQLGAVEPVPAWPPASPDPIEVEPLLALRSPLESPYASELPSAAPLPLSATRRSPPQPPTADAASAPTTSDGPSQLTMTSMASLSLPADSNGGSAVHSRTNSRINRDLHICCQGSRENLEVDAAWHNSGAATAHSTSSVHAHSMAAPCAQSLPQLASSVTQSLALVRPQAAADRAEGSLIVSPTGSREGAACVISGAQGRTPEKLEHLPLRALVGEEGACASPPSDHTATQRTAPPTTTTHVAKKRVNAQGGAVPIVPAIHLPTPYSIPVSDSERSLASPPALGYGPRSTPNAFSLASVRSGRSARSARHSSRCATTLRNGLPTLRELFPTLPDELYLTRDRLIIWQDSKRRLGSGAYGTVQQAELYPPGVEVPRLFTPTAESLTSPSVSSTPRFPPGNRRVSVRSFSSIAAALGSSESVCDAAHPGYGGAEQTLGPGATAPVSEACGHIHLRSMSMLSSDSATTSALPLHQQPYNEQTAPFYNSLYDVAVWGSAVECIRDPSGARALSSNNNATPNMTTAQATVLSTVPDSHGAPVYGAVSTDSSEFQQSTPQSPSLERPLQQSDTTAEMPAESWCEAQNGPRTPTVMGLRSGRKTHFHASFLTSPLVSPYHRRGSGCCSVAAADDADNSTALVSVPEGGRDCPASSFVSVLSAKGEQDETSEEAHPRTERFMASVTSMRTFSSLPSPVMESCGCRSSSACEGQRAASEREGENAPSGPCTCPSFTSPTTRGDSIGVASVAAAEGGQASCSETVVPPTIVDVCMDRLSKVTNLVSSRLLDDAGATDHTLQAAGAADADASGNARATDCDCLPYALPHSLVKGTSFARLRPAMVTASRRTEGCPSSTLKAGERCGREPPAAGEIEERKRGEPAEKASTAPESQGSGGRRQSTRDSLEVSRASFLVSVSNSELQLRVDGSGDKSLTARQGAKRALRDAQEEHQHTRGQSPEETETIPRSGIHQGRRGRGSSSAVSEAQAEERPDGEAAVATSAAAVAGSAGKEEEVAQCFAHLRTGSPDITSATTSGGMSTGAVAAVTHAKGDVGSCEILEAHAALGSTPTLCAPSRAARTAAAAAAAWTMPTGTTAGPDNAGCTLVLSETTNPLQLSLDFPPAPVVHYSLSSPMMSEALASEAVPFRSVATKVIKKMDLAYNAMKLNAFHNELRMASRLHHPCLVNMFGVAEDTENFYLVMDLAERGDLAQYQQQFGVKDTREMAPRFIADIVLALEYLGDGSQHSYLMTPPPDSTDGSLLHDHSRSTSGTLGRRGAPGAAHSMEPHDLLGSASAQSLLHSSDSAAAPTVSNRLVLCGSNTFPLPTRHTGEAESADEDGADMLSSTSALGPAQRESTCEPLKSLSRTSSTAFEYGFPAPTQTVTHAQQQAGDGRSLAWQDSIIVHRDLKPENLLLTWDFHVKLADFGDACFFGDDEANKFGGTPSYISPEMVAHCKASPYSDLWALGCVLYELLVGERLFSGSLVEVGIAVQKFRPEALVFPEPLTAASASSSTVKEVDVQGSGSEARAAISEAAKDLVRQLLQPAPEERLGSAERGGFDTLKAHSFFADISWDELLQTTNMTVTNTDYTLELAEYLEPAEAVVYCSPVKLLSAVERSSTKGCWCSENSSSRAPNAQGVLVMVLTNTPRLFLVSPDFDMVQFEVPWTAELRVSVLSADRFTITLPASGALRSPSTPVPEARRPPPATARTSPMREGGSRRTTAEGAIAYTFSDRNRRADLWGVKIHQLQSMCPEKPEPCSAAGARLPHLCVDPAVSTSGEASTLLWLAALSQQQPHPQCRGTPTLSPGEGGVLLQRLRTAHRITRAGSLGSVTLSRNARAAGALPTRVMPAARARASSFSRISSVSPSAVVTLSSAAAVPTSGPSLPLHLPDHQQPSTLAGAVLPSSQRRSTMTITIASSATSDPLHSSLHNSKPTPGSSDGACGAKSRFSSGCPQADTRAQPAAPPLCSPTSASAYTPGTSPTSTTTFPVGGEHSSQCGGNLSPTHWKGHLLTPATSICASAGTLHPLSVSSTATLAARSVSESVLGCCTSADNATPHLACSGGFGGGEGDSRLDDSLEGVHEARSLSEGTPGSLHTPKQTDSATGTPAGWRWLGLHRDSEEGCTACGGTPISPLAGTTATAAAAATKFPIKPSQARQQFQLAQKMKGKP